MIAREYKRNKQQVYGAEQEQELAQKRRLSSHRKKMKSKELIETIEN